MPQATSTPFINFDTHSQPLRSQIQITQPQSPQIQIAQPQTPTSNVQMPNLSININVNTPKTSNTHHVNGERVMSDEMVPVNHTLIRTPERSQIQAQQQQQQLAVAAKSTYNITAKKRIDFISPPFGSSDKSSFIPIPKQTDSPARTNKPDAIQTKILENENNITSDSNISISRQTIVDQSPSASIAEVKYISLIFSGIK